MQRKIPKVKEGDFYEVINGAIKENRHKEYLLKVLDDFKRYKQVFSEAFTDKNSFSSIYTFHVTYINKHPVWRDIIIKGNQTFCDLAETIIEWMGWDNDHMHGFSIKKVSEEPQHRFTEFSMYAPGWEDDPYPTYKTNEIKIADIDSKKNPKWGFVFDFGDCHEFDVELRKVEEKIKDLIEPLPTCVDQRGVAPIQYPPCP